MGVSKTVPLRRPFEIDAGKLADEARYNSWRFQGGVGQVLAAYLGRPTFPALLHGPGIRAQ